MEGKHNNKHEAMDKVKQILYQVLCTRKAKRANYEVTVLSKGLSLSS